MVQRSSWICNPRNTDAVINPGTSTASGKKTEDLQFYYHPDHLGSSNYITDVSGEVYQHHEYFPLGETFVEERNDAEYTTYQFNGKGLDEETGLYYYGARYYDPRVSMWQSVDPKMEKYTYLSPYAYCTNNPIITIDPDGRDVVYFDLNGVETHRVASTTEFKTFIQSVNNIQHPTKSLEGWKEVPMPKIIQERTQSGENVSGTAYQENDYLIAARVGLFNQTKNNGKLNLFTEGGNPIPQDAIKNMPDLDPTVIKAMAIQESHNGTTGVDDLLTANNPLDWNNTKSLKEEYGMTKDMKLNKNQSLYYGIRMVASKGFKGGVTYDKKTGTSTFNFQGWESAIKFYNWPGVKKYQEYIKTMVDNSKIGTLKDY